MNKIYKKYILSFIIMTSLVCGIFLISNSVLSADDGVDLWSDPVLNNQDFGADKLDKIGLGKTDPREIATNIIRIVLGLLGIIAVLIVMYGGYVWMTASGDMEKVENAKKILRSGVIGLLIILSAFAIATYILNRFVYSTGATSSQFCIYGEDAPRYCIKDTNCMKSCQPDGKWGPCLGSDCSKYNPGNDDDDDDDDDKKGPGEYCGAGETQEECSRNIDECAEYLTCDYESENNKCQCNGPPVIEFISPIGGFCNNAPDTFCINDENCSSGGCNISVPNGAIGNLITIHGKNFMDYDSATSKIFFWGGSGYGAEASLAEVVNPNCIGSWSDKQIVVIVPDTAQIGAIKIEAANGSDVSNNEVGPVLEDFVVNNIVRPGLCRINPNKGKLDTSVNYYGINLANSATAYFGNVLLGNVKANNSNFNLLSGTANVPNIRPGITTTYVQDGNDPNSNFLRFKKESEPVANPMVASFDPDHGPVGQYVTIKGSGFGSFKGNNTVYFGLTEANFDFPDICANNLWNENQIIVKVPKELKNDNSPHYIKVVVGDKEAVSFKEFNFLPNQDLSPSLCRIDPIFGQHNDRIQLWGEYFGKFNNDSKIRFTLDKDQSGSDIVYWDKERTSGIKPDKVITTINQQAISGAVRVVKGNLIGNGLNLTIGKCQDDADCGNGVCCPNGTPEEGRCQDSADSCYGSSDSSVYEWSFSTGNDISCPPNRPVQCEDNSCCSSLDNCILDTNKGMTTCADGDSCSGYASVICVDSIFCPNSPGNCSQNPSITSVAGSCDCSILYPGSSYSSIFNRCVINNKSCSLDTKRADIDGNLVDQYCANYNGQPKWHLETDQTCPEFDAPFNNVIKLPNNNCVYIDADCDLCNSGLECLDNDGQGVCATRLPVCPNNFKCINETKLCTRTEGLCECCCNKDDNNKDGTNEACCAPLTCANDCGTSAIDLNDSDDKWGYCSGCADVGNTQAEHDSACNCVGTSGKYCDTSVSGGVCRDCSQIGAIEECGLHESCCVKYQQGNACGAVKETSYFEHNNNLNLDIKYCGYYNCNDNCKSPNKEGRYSLNNKCLDECPVSCSSNSDPNICTKDDTMCPDDKPYCNDSCVCVKDGNNPGQACKDEFDSCSLPCVIGYTCLDNKAGYGSGADSDTCRCCCDPNAKIDSCKSINKSLECWPNISPCTSADDKRGMCCGCKADEECGDPNQFGCGKDTCCFPRPVIETVYPEVDKQEVCRNTAISIQFNKEMDSNSILGNIILAGDYKEGLCPENTELLTEVAVVYKTNNFIARAFNKLRSLLAKIFPILAKHEVSAGPLGNMCIIKGKTSVYNTLKDNEVKTVANFAIDKALDPGIEYFVIIKGDKNLNSKSGVLSSKGIGLKGKNLTSDSSFSGTQRIFNGIEYPNAQIWSFTTGNEVCQLYDVEIDPKQHLYQKPFDDYNFKAKAVSENMEYIQRINGVYNWTWTWWSNNVDIVNIKEFKDDNDPIDHSLATATSGNHEDAQTWIYAQASIIEDTISPVSTVGRTVDNKAKVILFMCVNPWPFVSDPNNWPIRWEDSDSNCTPGLEGDGCVNNHFSIYYCRDEGDNTTMDDLPALAYDPDNPVLPAIRGIYEHLGHNGMTKVLKDFLFAYENKPDTVSSWEVNNNETADKGGEAIVTWDDRIANSGHKFKIYYGTASKYYKENILVDSSPRVITGLDNNTTYYFNMTVINDKKVESNYNTELSVKVEDVKAPNKPVGVSAVIDSTNVNNKKIKINWQLETFDISNYIIEYGPYNSPAIRLNVGLNNSYTINNLNNIDVQDYFVRVLAVDANNNESSKTGLLCNYCNNVLCNCNLE